MQLDSFSAILCHRCGRGVNKRTCTSTHKRKESIIFSVDESMNMERADNLMWGKAASTLVVFNSKWSCQTRTRVRKEREGIQ